MSIYPKHRLSAMGEQSQPAMVQTYFRRVSGLLLAGLVAACSGTPPGNGPGATKPAASASPSTSPGARPSAVPAASPALAGTLSLKGHILMPSGLQQSSAGILMPSGILLPSGILMPSGFQTQSEATGSVGYSKVRFKILAYDQDSGALQAETVSDEQGAYVLSLLTAGSRLRLQAQALKVEQLVLEAVADLPAKASGTLTRNLSVRTTAALLLAEALKAERTEVPVSTVQNDQAFSASVAQVSAALTQKLGQPGSTELSSLLATAAKLVAEARSLLTQKPDLQQRQPDPLSDPSFFPPGFDPAHWQYSTVLHRPLPALPDGSCPPAPPRPDGQPVVTPTPRPDGLCPPPPPMAWVDENGFPITPDLGTPPPPMPGQPTPDPAGLCPPAGGVGPSPSARPNGTCPPPP